MEMMIAIIVLGLGLVMVATVFPVAWGRARKLSEFTSQEAIAETAYTTVKLLGRVDSLELNIGSFAGDLLYDNDTENLTPTPPYPGTLVVFSDTRVHALNLENILVSGRLSTPEFVEEDPFEREGIRDAFLVPFADIEGIFGDALFLNHQVRFRSRVYPPLPARESPDLSIADPAWDAALGTRRFAWAVFHRLHEATGPDNPSAPLGPPYVPQYETEAAINTTRVFDVYPVTLRRPRSTSRYAQQDPDFVPNPHDLSAPVVAPAALPSTDDVKLPVPWRVQVWIPATEIPENRIDWLSSGIPTEIEVPVFGAPPGAAFLVDMFPTGAWFIDEISGEIYRVTKRRVSVDGNKAFLTLHREMTFDDVEIPVTYYPCGGACFDGTIQDPEERRRTVWVFPPPVDAVRGPGDVPVFSGSQPVVSIEIRSLSVFP